ncbi:hypothetical protein HID58_023731, partial [Brassica napus]
LVFVCSLLLVPLLRPRCKGLWFLPTSLLQRSAHEVSFGCGVRQSLESRRGVVVRVGLAEVIRRVVGAVIAFRFSGCGSGGSVW